MNKEQYEKAFRETMEEMEKIYTTEETQRIIDTYSDERGKMDLINMFSYAYTESFNKSVKFIHKVLEKLLEVEE